MGSAAIRPRIQFTPAGSNRMRSGSMPSITTEATTANATGQRGSSCVWPEGARGTCCGRTAGLDIVLSGSDGPAGWLAHMNAIQHRLVIADHRHCLSGELPERRIPVFVTGIAFEGGDQF